MDANRSPIQRPISRRLSVVCSLSLDLEITWMIAKEPRTDNGAGTAVTIDERCLEPMISYVLLDVNNAVGAGIHRSNVKCAM
eukprot:scaffold3752_cov285-Chaetoceros_neogracile.AAC.8